MGILQRSVPIHSSLLVSAEEAAHFFELLPQLPSSIRRLIFSAKTGAYVRGVAKAHDLPDETAPLIALAILRVAVGDVPLANFAATLSSELKIANDVAQKMAQELEHDLFAPITGDMSQYLAAKKQLAAAAAGVAAREAGATNVLDLKQQTPRPTPPPIPRPPKPPTPPQVPR